MSKGGGLFGPAGAFTASSIQTREGLAGWLADKKYHETLARLPNILGPTALDLLEFGLSSPVMKVKLITEASQYMKDPIAVVPEGTRASHAMRFLNYKLRVNSYDLQGFGRQEFSAALSQLQFNDEKVRNALQGELNR